MGWLKVAAVAVGALIVFMVVGTVIHLFFELLVAALVVGAVVAAIKVAGSRRRLSGGRRDYRDYELRTPRPEPTATPRPGPAATSRPTAHTTADVEDDLARLRREMGG